MVVIQTNTQMDKRTEIETPQIIIWMRKIFIFNYRSDVLCYTLHNKKQFSCPQNCHGKECLKKSFEIAFSEVQISPLQKKMAKLIVWNKLQSLKYYEKYYGNEIDVCVSKPLMSTYQSYFQKLLS